MRSASWRWKSTRSPTSSPSSASRPSKPRPCLRRVVDEIDVPIFTFDPEQILRLVNAAGERLLQQPSARVLGRTATELGLDACFEAPNATLGEPVVLHAERPLDGAQALVPPERRAAHADRALRCQPRACAKKNAARGSGSSACWVTSSTIRWRRSCRSPAVWRRGFRNSTCPSRPRSTFSAGSTSSSRAPRRCTASCSRTGGWRTCRRRSCSRSSCGRWPSAWRYWRRGCR